MALLSLRRQRFVAEYLHDLNATQAAIRAGYSPATAKSQGSRLLTFVDVSSAIAEAQQEYAERTAVNAEWIVQQLVHEVETAPRASDRIRSLELLGRRLGMFKDRVLHEPAIPDTSAFRDWTIPELKDAIAVMKAERHSVGALIEGTAHIVESDAPA